MAVTEIGISPRKALETVLYIAARIPKADLHEVLKVRYFADKFHLAEYGFAASGDDYVAMDFGPVASNIYDLLKVARGTASGYDMRRFAALVKGSLTVDAGDPHGVHALRAADTDYLSKSDLEAIEKSIALCARLDFKARTALSHDAAYEEAWALAKKHNRKQYPMPIHSIAGTLKNSDEVLEHIAA